MHSLMLFIIFRALTMRIWVVSEELISEMVIGK